MTAIMPELTGLESRGVKSASCMKFGTVTRHRLASVHRRRSRYHTHVGRSKGRRGRRRVVASHVLVGICSANARHRLFDKAVVSCHGRGGKNHAGKEGCRACAYRGGGIPH